MFDEFLDWQDERYLRATGARLAPSLLGHVNVTTTGRIYHHATALDSARYLDWEVGFGVVRCAAAHT